jgi:hypothetical protein
MQRVSHAHRAEGTQVCSVRAMATQRVPGHEPTIVHRALQSRPQYSHPAHRDNLQPVELATIDKGGRVRYSGKGTSPGVGVFKEDGGSCPVRASTRVREAEQRRKNGRGVGRRRGWWVVW